MADVQQKQQFIKALFVLFLVLVSGSNYTSEATVCTPGLASVIGTEYVANKCPGEGSTFNYYVTDLQCINGTVQRNPGTSGDRYYENVPPESLHNYLISLQDVKLFRNTAGTRFVLMHRYFANGGTIDGINMSGFPFSSTMNYDIFNKVLFVNPSATVPCCLKVQTFTSSKTSFTPTKGETVTLNGSIFSNYPTTWNLTVSDRVFNGSGNSASRTWDGKNSAGTVVPPGTYSAGLTVTTSEVVCTASGSVGVEVKGPPEEICDGIDNNGNDLVDEVCWGKGYLNTNNGVEQVCR